MLLLLLPGTLSVLAIPDTGKSCSSPVWTRLIFLGEYKSSTCISSKGHWALLCYTDSNSGELFLIFLPWMSSDCSALELDCMPQKNNPVYVNLLCYWALLHTAELVPVGTDLCMVLKLEVNPQGTFVFSSVSSDVAGTPLRRQRHLPMGASCELGLQVGLHTEWVDWSRLLL